MSKFNWMPILKTGTFTAKSGKQVTFSEGDLDKIVSNTDLSKEPQFVIEHPSFDKLGFGTIESLKRVGSYLFALPKTVDEKFKAIVNSGDLPGRSISINDNDYAMNHIGFLPKEIEPAVDGLGAYSFSNENNTTKLQLSLPGVQSHFAELPKDASDNIEFAQIEISSWPNRIIKEIIRNIKNKFIELYGADEAEKIIPEYDIEEVGKAPAVIDKTTENISTANNFSQSNDGDKMDFSKIDLSKLPADTQETIKSAFTNLETQLTTAKTELQAANTKLTDVQLKEVRAEVLQFCESDEIKLKIKPADKEKVVAYLTALKEKSVIEFSQTDNTKVQLNSYDFAKEMIKAMPDVITMDEFATKKKAGSNDVSDDVKLGQEIAAFANRK